MHQWPQYCEAFQWVFWLCIIEHFKRLARSFWCFDFTMLSFYMTRSFIACPDLCHGPDNWTTMFQLATAPTIKYKNFQTSVTLWRLVLWSFCLSTLDAFRHPLYSSWRCRSCRTFFFPKPDAADGKTGRREEKGSWGWVASLRTRHSRITQETVRTDETRHGKGSQKHVNHVSNIDDTGWDETETDGLEAMEANNKQ